MDQPAYLDETITVFELLDKQPELEMSGVSPAAVMRGEELPQGYDELIQGSADMTARDVQESGSSFLYDHDAGSLLGDYSPDASLGDGDILHAGIHYDHEPLTGDAVEDAQVEIVRALQAPYLDRGRTPQQAVAPTSIGTLEVPADYDRDALEQSVEAAVARLDVAADLQDAVPEIAAQYAEAVASELDRQR